MSVKEFIIHFTIYAVGFAFVAVFLPWYIFVPLATAAIYLHLSLVNRKKKQRYQTVLKSIRNIQFEAFDDFGNISGRDIDQMIFESFQQVAAELEKRCFQLVEKNIQLLSLKEIGLTIISSLDEEKIVDSVTTFLSKGLGFKELFVGIFDHDNHAINLYTFREQIGKSSSRKLSVSVGDVEGLLKKAILSKQSLLIKDPDMHPLGQVKDETLFEDSTMESFILVPLLKSTSTQACWESPDCLAKPRSEHSETAQLTDKCSTCHRFPVLGIIGVTDGFKAASLSKVDLVSIETLALQIGTILENTRLYTELKKEEGFRDNVINSMLNCLITIDKSGRIVLANESAEKLTDYSSDELIGMKVDEVFVDGIQDENLNPVMNTLRTGRRNFQREAWIIKKDSTKRPVVLNTSLLLYVAKQVQGVLGVFYDITRIKRMEQKIMHLDKLAALGRFSSSMAHEIRNPLTGIAAGIQYLKRAGSIPDDQMENVTFILDEVNRIDRLIGDIMNVVRIGDLMYENIRIETLLKNCIVAVKDLADQKNVQITTDFPRRSRPVIIDNDRITQVMINLIKNAIEASSEKEDVFIRVSFPEDVSDVLFDDVRDYVIIEVQDHGVGLADDEKQKIFEPFFSTKQTGTGLGLYVSHSIIERHGGYIFVESSPGAGSSFTVYLPVEKVPHGGSNEVSHTSGR